MTQDTDSTPRTITLTDRRPVKIDPTAWPVRASADWKDWDNQYECQANRTWKAWLRVRQHIDGRTLVYGGYDYSTCWQGESGATFRDGVLLTPTDDEYPPSSRTAEHDWTGERVIAAIREVGERLQSRSECEHFGNLIAECIADLPAETL